MLQEQHSSLLNPKIQNFLLTIERFQKLVAQSEFLVDSHTEASLERFMTLPEAAQDKIISRFEQYLQFLIECSELGVDLKFDQLLVKTFLQKSNMIYDADLIDSVGSEDVIEIYDAELTQVFRNLRFLDVCSYSILELVSHEPYELYERSVQINHMIQETVQNIMGRPFDLKPLDVSHIPLHLTREKFSRRKLTSTVQFKLAYPLFTWPKKLAGFLLILKGKNTLSPDASVEFI